MLRFGVVFLALILICEVVEATFAHSNREVTNEENFVNQGPFNNNERRERRFVDAKAAKVFRDKRAIKVEAYETMRPK